MCSSDIIFSILIGIIICMGFWISFEPKYLIKKTKQL